ncbi:MAG: hypothetical protein M1480_18345 [Bacteroidetes bacterium]|nr:hypothetical protein [Bacteroidota bacterium]
MNSNSLLPENHRRSLSVTAKFIEEGLDEVESILNGSSNHSVTHIVETSYDNETKEKIYAIIKEIQSVNKEMFGTLSLTPQITYESRVVQSQAVYLWSILVDSTSKNLSRYGNLTPEESKLIDSYVQKLLALVDKLKEFN